MNIISKPYLQLFKPLDYAQAAPVGFLLVERFLVKIFHNSDSILRLFPLVCGIASLFLFYRLLKYGMSKTSALLALALFAVSNDLLYYSSSLKQYMCDVATVLILYLAAFHFGSKKLTIFRTVLFGLVGGISIWVSHPALFVLTGLGSTLTLFYLFRKDFSRLFRLTIVYLFWVLSFVPLYLTALRHSAQHKGLLQYWSSSFMPFPPTNTSEFMWVFDKFVAIFQDPAQLKFTACAVFIFLIGSISMAFRKSKTFFMLISPIFFALIASGLHKYPFHGRLLLFILPILYFFIAAGTDRLSFNSRIIRVVLMGLFVYHPFIIACHYLTEPRVKEEIIPVIKYTKQHWKRGHLLYLYRKSQPAFEYYAPNYGFTKQDYIISFASTKDRREYLTDLNKLRGKGRVWILLSHIYPNEIGFLLGQLNRMGVLLRSFRAPGAAVFLYDLS